MESDDLDKKIRSTGGVQLPLDARSGRDKAPVLDPIPVPVSARWREVRLRLVPGMMFLCSVGGAVWLWMQQGTTAVFTGAAEGRNAVVSSPVAGVLREVSVTSYQIVKQGDPIAVVHPLDPRMEINLLQLRVQAASRRVEPSLAQRTAIDYQRLKANVLGLKVEIAKNREDLILAEMELKRNEDLFRQKLVSEDAFDLALKRRDALRAEVLEKDKAIVELEAGLRQVEALTQIQPPDPTGEGHPTVEPVDLDTLLHTSNLGPITLTAPISGMVSFIHRGEGENVRDGEAVVTIQAIQTDRIVGYLRQPFPFEPEIGQEVVVKTRDLKPRLAVTTIRQVGAGLEPVTNALAQVRPGMLMDVGLPVILGLPPGLTPRPGELFDLTARPSPRSVHP